MTRDVIVCLILFSATNPAIAKDAVFRQPPAPEVNPWADKGIPSDFQFGAYYTRKNVEEPWHRQSRTDEYADVSVRFGNEPEELVFWRGGSYLPYWTTGGKKFSFKEIIPRTGDGPAERPDKVNRYSRVRIIQSTPKRVVVHWRYMPNMPENVAPENLPDQTRMVDEYFVVSPDRSVIRAVLTGQPRYEDWRNAAPGRVVRYQLTGTGIEEQNAERADTELMLEVMGFAGEKPRTVETLRRFGRVHILEQSPARVVLKWRYPLSTVGYEISYEDVETGWGNWSTWYMTIYPDGSIVKRMRIYMSESRRHEWQESMAIMGPEQRPEAVIDTTPALTVATGDGTIRQYSWIGAPPEEVDYTDTILHIVNMKARFDPYSIQRIQSGDIYRARGGTGYSAFPAWNHWPVGQFTSDGRHATFPDRTAHSSLTHIFWDDSTPFGEQGFFQEKLLLEGMSDQPTEELLPLAKSWLEPAVGESLTKGLTIEYDPAQRAYVLTRDNGQVRQLKVKLAASPQSPLVNPAFVVANWGSDKTAKISIDGKETDDSVDIRQGVVRRANGVNALVVWIEMSTTEPLQVTIQ